MLYIFHGKDAFLRQKEVDKLVKKFSLPVVFFDSENLPETHLLKGGDLFGGASIFILNGLLNDYIEKGEIIEKYKKSKNHIIFLEDSIDKRLKVNKTLLADPKIISVSCETPQGKELNSWIQHRAEELGSKISPVSVAELVSLLGFTDSTFGIFTAKETMVSLSYIDNELRKIITYAGTEPITPTMVRELVPNVGEVTGFEVVNALAEKNKKKLFALISRFYNQDSLDEKAKTIKLNSLLAEQFRNILMVQDFFSQKVKDNEVLTATGWKSGRLFVIKKMTSRFTRRQILSALGKLESLDMELKSGSTPPQVLLNLILVPLL